jgi:hypothetical protein
MSTKEEQNQILSDAGFRWRRIENDEEDVDLLGLPEIEWILEDTITDAPITEGVREAMERGAARGHAGCAAWLERNPGPNAAERARLREQRRAADEAARREADEAAQREREERKALADHQAAEHERMNAWRAENLADLVAVNAALPLPARRSVTEKAANWLPARIARFDTGAFGTGYHFFRFDIQAGPVVVEEYGNASVYWLTPEHAEAVHGAAWERAADTPGYRAMRVLRDATDGFGTYGSDLSRWAWERFGEDALVADARAATPFVFDQFSYASPFAKASKLWRLPLQCEWRGEQITGYGDPQSQRGGRHGALTAWVPVGEEDSAEWPDRSALDELQAEGQALAVRFRALFG